MAERRGPFHSIYTHGFLRAAVAIPEVRLAQPEANAEATLVLARQAVDEGAAVVVFPELGLSGYSLQDLLHQDAVQEASLAVLGEILEASRDLPCLLLVGLPVRLDGRLFNCGAALAGGRLLGLIPKTFLPNYREFYEARHFAPAAAAVRREVRLFDQTVPVGNDLLFAARELPGFVVHCEICEDLWAPLPPSTVASLGGATVLCNLSASNVTVGKAEYRRLLCASQSGRALGAYLYAAAGPGESTTDLAWDGHGMIWENGTLLAESNRFPRESQLVVSDLDLDRLLQERSRTNPFHGPVAGLEERVASLRRIEFDFEPPRDRARRLCRRIDRFPYVPADSEHRDDRCQEVYEIQVQGLAQRLRATGIEKVVVGVSGGLDSTQALVVAVKTMDRLGLDRGNVLAYTLPGFATSRRTQEQAWTLMRSLRVSAKEIDIRPGAERMLEDIGHPAARGEEVHDVTYENVQAGARTSLLFRLANRHGALVLGTGDLSELALGWTTYGVGDQMSHYNVNASVPKTLIRHLLLWEAGSGRVDEETAAVLRAIVGTEISPELVPGEGDAPAQRTEDFVGPYELQDFHLYYLSRFGFRPSKVAFLASNAWGDARAGIWPEDIPAEERGQYSLREIKAWLRVFLRRFFQTSQFKRSALPDGPKVGSGGSLSPRGDWRAPSDVSARLWLEELEAHVPEE